MKIRHILATLLIAMALSCSAQQLPAPTTTGGMPLMDAVQKRASIRNIDPNSSVSMQDLSNMLWAAWGITHDGKRAIATAMNRQELVLYVITADRIALYDAEQNTLTTVNTGDFRDICARQDWAKTAPINIALVVDTTKQPRPEFQNYTAGAASHAIYLYCASVGLKTVVRAMLEAPELEKAMKLPADQHVLYVQTVGK